MKVSNNKAGGPSAKVENTRTRPENNVGLKSDVKSGGLHGKGLGGSKVDVSERAQMMQKAKDIASDSSIDEAKVARLQKMIDDGAYSVDSEKVADRLVDEHLLIPD